MTRIAIVADSHFDEHSRFDECVSIHAWIADDIARRHVDVVLHAGDCFERKSTPKERLAFAAWVRAITEVAPLVIVRGNHDAVGDLPLFAKLETKHPVTVEESAAVHVVAGVAVGCLAWPRRAELLALVGSQGREATEAVAGDALRAVLRGLGSEMEQHHGARVLLSHAMVRGSETSTGQPLVGCDMEIGLDDLALAKADFVALGHIHNGAQPWNETHPTIAYPGSPRRATFGELEDKAYLIVDISPEAVVTVERVITPSTPMVHVEATIDGALQTVTLAEPVDVTGAEVRLCYTVDADQRELGKRLAADLRDELVGFGAVDVKVEEVVRTSTRARAPEVALAVSLVDKVTAYWDARSDAPTEEREVALVAKLHEIDEQVPRTSGAGVPGRFLAIRGRNIGPFKAFDVDLGALSGLVAVTGGNGAGKSTLLELLGGSFYRRCPTRGSLVDLSTARDSFLETEVWNGGTYTLRHLIDCVSKKSEAVALDGAGRPLTDAGKVREYDIWAERHLPSEDVLYTSTFAPQGSGGFLDLKPSARKAVLLRALGIERLEALAEKARAKLVEAKTGLEKLEARIEDERGRSGTIEAALEALTDAEAMADAARVALDQAEARVREAERTADTQRRALEERVAIERQIDPLDRDVIDAVRRRRSANDLAARAGEIADARLRIGRAESDLEAARAKLVERSAALATAERDAEEVARRATERRAVQEQILRLSGEMETARTDLARAESACSRAPEIDAAKLLVADLESHIARLRPSLDAVRGSLAIAERAHADEASAVTHRRVDLSACEADIRRLERMLVDEAAVLAATQRADAELTEIAEMRSQRGPLEERITRAEADLLSTKDNRISGLRTGLSTIAGNDLMEYSAAVAVSDDALALDNKAERDARDAPEAIRSDRRALVELVGRIEAADRRAADTGRLADRLPEMQRARVEQADALSRANTLLGAIAAASTRAAGRNEELADLRTQAARIEADIRTTEGDLADARRIAAEADSVARAQVHVETLTRDVVRLGTAQADAQERLAALPALPSVDAADIRERTRDAQAEVDALTREISTARTTLASADDVARASSEVEAADRDIERGEREIRDLREKLRTIESAPPVDVAAALASADFARGEKRARDNALGKANATVEAARESEARLGDLRALRESSLAEVADWTRLAADLGKDGLQALEADAAGPELAAIANDLLHSCVSRRWTIDIRTQRTSADGKKELERCDVMVLDTEQGREGEAETFSGGERVLIGEAVSLALSVFACRRLGIEGPTLVRDESGAALSPENGRRYIEMLRRAATTIRADRVLYVSHTPELQSLADARIHVGNGTARVVPVDFEPGDSVGASVPAERFADAAE